MKPVDTVDSAILELRSARHPVRIVVGLPLLLAGLAVVAFALGLLSGVPIPEEVPRPPMVMIGAVLAIAGAALTGGARGVVVDRHRRTLTTWWGVFAPIRTRERKLDTVERVTIGREIRRSNKKRVTVFPVRLEGPDQRYSIHTPADELAARRLGEAVARCLGWSLEDSSSGTTVVREAAHLDESLRDRVRRTGERVEAPAPPASPLSTVRDEGHRLVIDIPAIGVDIRAFFRIAVLVIGALMVLPFFGAIPDLHELPTTLLGVIFGGPILVAGILFVVAIVGLVRSRRPTRVEVDADRLQVDHRGRTVSIPLGELEELAVAGRSLDSVLRPGPDGTLTIDPAAMSSAQGLGDRLGPGGEIPAPLAGLIRMMASLSPDQQAIAARSDRVVARFGAGLGGDELVWLAAVLMARIAR